MKTVTQLHDIPADALVVGLGNFDGLHLGHQQVLQVVQQEAHKRLAKSVCLTFEPHPVLVLKPEHEPFLLTSFEQKSRYLEEMGLDYLCAVPFDLAVAQMTPQQFVQRILLAGPSLKAIVVGFNFRFGAQRQGTLDFLKDAMQQRGVDVVVVESYRLDGQVVSSSFIRPFVQEGRVEEAQVYLGRPVAVSGHVVHGASRGTGLGFPTANIDVQQEILPPLGVYVVRIRYNGCTYFGVMNVGMRPTFETQGRPVFEVHIFDFSQTIYDEWLDIEILTKLRDEKKFLNRADLISQVKLDCLQAKQYLEQKVEHS